MTATTTVRYYAIHDPHQSERITCWRETPGRLEAWPKGIRVGPIGPLTNADFPANKAERQRFRKNINQAQRDYYAKVRAQICADPDLARARFATFTTRCCICGRTLTDPESKALGIGPDCGRTVDDETRVHLADAVSRLLAEADQRDPVLPQTTVTIPEGDHYL